jgi:hypothetical protein
LAETYSEGPGAPDDCGESAEHTRPYYRYESASTSGSSSQSGCNRCAHSKVYY